MASPQLFHQLIFGPIRSRRLGISLGVNLLPVDGKLCTFDCIYCECGYNSQGKGSGRLPAREEVKVALEERLKHMKEEGVVPDVITFAGNGEPTLHPQFEGIIEDTLRLRDFYFPQAKVSVLSNATRIASEPVFRALNKVDNNILKLDSVVPSTIRTLNNPNLSSFSVADLIGQLKRFRGRVIIQTMFVRGTHNGQAVDNTTEEEIGGWIEALKEIDPEQVMIYTLDRPTPEKELVSVPVEELEAIADRVRAAGFDVSVSA